MRLCALALLLAATLPGAVAPDTLATPTDACLAALLAGAQDPCGVPLSAVCRYVDAGAAPPPFAGRGPATTRVLLDLVAGAPALCPQAPCEPGPGGWGTGEGQVCRCDLTAATPTDTDGDRAPNGRDVDDDCDHLSDRLEASVGMGARRFDDPLDLSPFSEEPVALWVDLAEIWDLPAGLEFRGNDPPDLYATAATASFRKAGGEDARWTVPGFNEADHPDDPAANPVVFAPHPLHPGWKATLGRVALSERIDDALTYGWLKDGMPQLQVRLPRVMDHDSHDAAGTGADDLVGDVELPTHDLLQLAQMVNGALDPGSLVAAKLGGATVKLHVAVSASPCAVAWAHKVVLGKAIVEPGDLPRAPSAASC